jgi:hypothetical protein
LSQETFDLDQWRGAGGVPISPLGAAKGTRSMSRSRPRTRRWVLARPGVAAALLAAASPALADWQDDLAAQLRWDHECLVQYYSGVIERLVDGQLLVIAKAHCEDGRTFDAIQRDELEDFEVTECTPTEQAC